MVTVVTLLLWLLSSYCLMNRSPFLSYYNKHIPEYQLLFNSATPQSAHNLRIEV